MQDKERWFWSKIVLLIGISVLVAGFSFTVFKAIRSDRETMIQNNTGDLTDAIIDAYGFEEGSIDLRSFLSDPQLSAISGRISDGPAKVTLTLSDGTVYIQYHPSRSDFESGGLSSSDRRFVNVELGDGSILPGTLEVTVVEA